MPQLDSGTFQQVKDLVLSGYHLNDIHGLACPTALLPDGTNVESLERSLWSDSASVAPWAQPALKTLSVTQRDTPAQPRKLAALSMLTI